MSLPQYAKSADPEVIAAIEKNEADMDAAVERIKQWSRERGGGGDAAVRWAWGGVLVHGLPSKPEGFGRWTATAPHRPFKNNTAEVEAMDALDYRPDTIPGSPGPAYGERRRDWSRMLMSPAPFVVDGVAYHGYSEMPDQDANGDIGPQWVEIKGSEYLAAKEALLADRQAARS